MIGRRRAGDGLIALIRAVSPRLAECELTHLAREPIDVAKAAGEHASYEQALGDLGCEVRALEPAPELADSVFVEDTALVLDEIAIITRPGAASRQGEVAAIRDALATWRTVAMIHAPGTLDGGDVLHAGRTLFVGAGGRSNAEGIRQLGALTAPHGYQVVPVLLRGCLHLKSAATEVAERLLLLNPEWVDAVSLRGMDTMPVHPTEPNAANALRVGDTVVHAAEGERTRRRLEAIGLTVVPVPAGELAKAEAGVSCCSVIFPAVVRGGIHPG